MHNVEAYTRLPGFALTLRDLKNAASALLDRLSRLRTRQITVTPVSDEWCQRHLRDSVKH